MAGHQDGRNGQRIESLEAPGDGNPCVVNVFSADFIRGKLGRHRYRTIKIVRVGSPVGWDFASRLRPGGGEFRMGVHYAADTLKFFVEQKMRRQIRRRAQAAFHDLPIQIGDHHVGGSQGCVVYPAWLDHHQAPVAIDPTGIAEGEHDQSLADQLQIGLEHLFFQSLQGNRVSRIRLGGIGHRS